MTTHWPDIIGADRGFSVSADTLTETVDGVSLNLLWQEFMDAQAVWNSTRDPLVAILTFSTTDSNDVLRLDGDADDFELASEFGSPKSIRPDLPGMRVGFPYFEWDTATRYTRRFLRNATAEEIRARHTTALEADNRLLFRETLKALMTRIEPTRPTNWEGVPIFSIYSGSADDLPPSYLGRTFAGSHNHFFVSGATAIDGQDLADLINAVQEHGHGLRGSNERVVVMLHPDEAAIVRGFRAGIAGSPWDFIPATDAPAYLTDQTIVGDRPSPRFNELPIFGSFGDALLTESYLVPEGYVVAVATAGAGSRRNVLAFREHPRPESRGLRLIEGVGRYPLVESVYERNFGVGVRNRGAAAVMQIKSSGSYVTPTIR